MSDSARTSCARWNVCDLVPLDSFILQSRRVVFQTLPWVYHKLMDLGAIGASYVKEAH